MTINDQELWVNVADDYDDLGTAYAGCIIATYDQLTALFGEPLDADWDPRADVFWQVEEKDGGGIKVITYNYKDTLQAPEVSETRFWHVDSPQGEVGLEWIRALVPGNERLEVPVAKGPYRVGKVEMSTIFLNVVSAAGNVFGWVTYDGGEVSEEQRVAQAEANARMLTGADVLADALQELYQECRHKDGFAGLRRLQEIVRAAYLRARGRPIDEPVQDRFDQNLRRPAEDTNAAEDNPSETTVNSAP